MLTIEDLATSAGTAPETIDRLMQSGVLPAPDEDGFPPSLISRVRLLLALEASGLSVEQVASAIATKRLSLDFIDHLMPDVTRLLPSTQRQTLETLDLPVTLSSRLRSILGTAGAPDDAQIRSDDAEVFSIAAQALAMGADEEQLVGTLVAYIESVRRLADSQRDFIDEVLIRPALESGQSIAQALATTTPKRRAFRLLGRRLMTVLHERMVEDVVFQNVVELVESSLTAEGIPRPGGTTPAIAFADVSGFTRMAAESGDRAAARQAGRFAELVQAEARGRRGRLVKLLGDGAMMYFGDTASAVRCVLALVDGAEAGGLPPIHAGVNTGEVVRRDGDLFGSVVNIAARTADYARPREVLVTAAAVDAWDGAEDVRFVEVGSIALKNVIHPVDIFQASRYRQG